MDKITYLAELAEGLARWVPERERQDILRYYAEYFEEAGPGREAEVVAELGDPWALSCRLAVEGGYVTHEQAVSWRPRKTWRRVLIGAAVGLTVFTLVFGFGLMAVNVMQGVRGLVLETSVAVQADDPLVGAAFELTPDGAVTIVDSDYFPFDAGQVTFIGDVEFESTGLIENREDSVAGAFSSIDVDISLGNIQVVAGDGCTLTISRSKALSGCEPTWEIRNGVLRLRDGDLPRQVRVNSWDDLKNLFGTGQWTVDVIITVPAGAALDNINVETGLGNILLYGVNAETVTAETGVGKVECYEARNVRKLELTTGVGDVGLILEEVRSGLNVNLESGTGNVEVSLGCSERDCRYELESGLGLVTVNGVVRGSNAEHKGSTLYRLDAESGTGSVNVHFISG